MSQSKDLLTETFINYTTFLNNIKLFHFQTEKYSEHKSSDTLYSELLDGFDKLMEVLQGKYGKLKPIKDLKVEIRTIADIKVYAENFIDYIVDLEVNSFGDPLDSDITAILSEHKALVNRFIYLLKFK